MNKIYEHPNFEEVNSQFQKTKDDSFVHCAWTKFIDIQKDISKGLCPVCEQKLDEKNERHTGASIDHFRPKKNKKNDKQVENAYAFLECEERNYILMCKGCNDEYKKSEFPLDTDFVATNLASLSLEKPLLLNLREEDPFDYFELIFIEQYLPLSILELKIRKELSEDSYEFRKAEKTIEFFGLGKCYENEPMRNKKGLCKAFENRIFTLALHYDSLYELAKAIHEKRDFEELLKDNPRLIEYGFFRFLIEGQFKID